MCKGCPIVTFVTKYADSKDPPAKKGLDNHHKSWGNNMILDDVYMNS